MLFCHSLFGITIALLTKSIHLDAKYHISAVLTLLCICGSTRGALVRKRKILVQSTTQNFSLHIIPRSLDPKLFLLAWKYHFLTYLLINTVLFIFTVQVYAYSWKFWFEF